MKMKEMVLTAVLALLLTSCGNTAADSDSTDSLQTSQSASSGSAVSSKTWEEYESKGSDKYNNEEDYYVSVDESVNFDSYDTFASSDELKNALADCGIELESLSEPDFDSEKYTIESVTMYPECAYYFITDNENNNGISVCVQFDRFNDYTEMCSYLDGLYYNTEDFAMINDTETDSEKETYAVDGNHFSVFRLSRDGLLYSVFSENVSNQQVYSYAEDIRL